MDVQICDSINKNKHTRMLNLSFTCRPYKDYILLNLKIFQNCNERFNLVLNSTK